MLKKKKEKKNRKVLFLPGFAACIQGEELCDLETFHAPRHSEAMFPLADTKGCARPSEPHRSVQMCLAAFP